jgi:S1-C subfamily serine protease
VVTPILAIACCVAQEADPSARQVYARVVESVVAVRSMARLGERSGSGVVISEDGLILCSYATVPEGAQSVRVWLKGPRMLTAQVVAASRADEVTLLRVKPAAPLRPIRMGRSRDCAVGEAVLSVGNAQNSFINDDMPSLQRGLISGRYGIGEPRGGATYRGELLETTAAVNEHMEGAPLLNLRGEMIGMVTLNYTPSRWLGHAIPSDWIGQVVERLRQDAGVAAGAAPETAAAGPGDLGLTLRQEGRHVVVAAVRERGPAAAAGVSPGDRLLEISGQKPNDLASARDRLAGVSAGSLVWLTIESGGEVLKVKLTAQRKED